METKEKRFWISCTITPEEQDKLFLLARESGKTVSGVMSELVREALEENALGSTDG